jgi:hypothetical protein
MWETNHGKLGIETRVDAEFKLRRASAHRCAYGAGYGGELIWDAPVTG